MGSLNEGVLLRPVEQESGFGNRESEEFHVRGSWFDVPRPILAIAGVYLVAHLVWLAPSLEDIDRSTSRSA